MLAPARKTMIALLVAAGFASCATEKKTPLISDTQGPESSLPWNEQKDWEREGQMKGMRPQDN